MRIVLGPGCAHGLPTSTRREASLAMPTSGGAGFARASVCNDRSTRWVKEAAAEMNLSRPEIEAILAHRGPFLLIDEVHDLEPGERLVARKTVRADEWY